MKPRKKARVAPRLSLRWFPYDLLRVLFWSISLILLPIKYYYVDGRPRNRRIRGGAIIIANHASHLDPVIIMQAFAARRVIFMTGEILYEQHFLFSWFLNIIGCIRINRGAALNMDSFNRALSVLKAGSVVCVFPEGQIGSDNQLLPFKSGVILLAALSNTPIIPIYMADHARALHQLHVIVGKPIVPQSHLQGEPLNTHNVEHLSELLYADMLTLKTELETKIEESIAQKE